MNIQNFDAGFNFVSDNFSLGIIGLLGIKYKTYEGELPNELTEINKQYRLDKAYDFEDFVQDLEFFSTPLKNTDILRCLIYAVLLHKREKRPTLSVIICIGGKQKNIILSYFYSHHEYSNPIIIDNSAIEGLEKLNNNEKLTEEDKATLSIIATYNTNQSKEKLISEGMTHIKKAKLEKEEEIKVEAIQFILFDIIIKNKEQLKKI